MTLKDSWRHFPGELNTAVIHSRGQNAKDTPLNSKCWNWPIDFAGTRRVAKVFYAKLKKNVAQTTRTMVNNSQDEPRDSAFVLKFSAKLKNCMKSQENHELIFKELTASEINKAEIV